MGKIPMVKVDEATMVPRMEDQELVVDTTTVSLLFNFRGWPIITHATNRIRRRNATV
jgi:hypothetical protein